MDGLAGQACVRSVHAHAPAGPRRAPVWFQLQAHSAAAADVACGGWGLGLAAASTQAGGECKAGQAAGQGSSASTNQGAQRGTQQQQQQDTCSTEGEGERKCTSLSLTTFVSVDTGNANRESIVICGNELESYWMEHRRNSNECVAPP